MTATWRTLQSCCSCMFCYCSVKPKTTTKSDVKQKWGLIRESETHFSISSPAGSWLVLSQRGTFLPVKKDGTGSQKDIMSTFSHVNYSNIWNSNINDLSRSSLNNAKQSASESIILAYLLRPVLYAVCMYARGKHILFYSVVHKLVPFWGLYVCVEKRQYFRDKECRLISCWIKFKMWTFLWLGAILKLGWASIKGKQCTGICVLRGVSAGGNHPLDQKRGFQLSFYITPVLWCSSQSKALFQCFHLEWNPGPLKSVTKLTQIALPRPARLTSLAEGKPPTIHFEEKLSGFLLMLHLLLLGCI